MSEQAEPTAEMLALAARVDELYTSIDMLFLFSAGVICFLLQAGFGLLEVGCIRAKNAQNIMIKNIMDAVMTAWAYYLIGYSVAYGKE